MADRSLRSHFTDRRSHITDQNSSSARSALAALTDYAPPHRPYASYAFLALCVLVTVPSLVHPPLYDLFGGIEPRRYPWQVFTAVFEHGFPGFDGSAHLLLNAILILVCGRPCERLLGWRRFVMLSVAAMTANAGVQLLTEGVNGSSLVIWAWGPPLYLALRWAKGRDETATGSEVYGRIRAVLVIMYLAVTAFMAFVPYQAGWRGNPVVALFLGNLYHLMATLVGIAFAWIWSDQIRSRMVAFAEGTPLE